MAILGIIIGVGVVAAFIWRGAVMQDILDEWVVKDTDEENN